MSLAKVGEMSLLGFNKLHYLPANLYLLGFPKAGTTSFAEWIAGESVFVPKVKEPGYLGEVDPGISIKTEKAYLALYQNCKQEGYAADFTTTYVYYDGFPNAVLAKRPDARFVSILREPNRAAHSMFLFNSRMGGELTDYRSAVSTLERRREGKALPKFVLKSGCNINRCQYDYLFDYKLHLTALSKEVLDRTFFCTYEYMISSFEDFRSRLSTFLEAPLPASPLPTSNVNSNWSRNIAASFLAYPPGFLNEIKLFVKRRFDLADTRLMNNVYALLSRSAAQSGGERVVNDFLEIYDVIGQKKALRELGVHGLDYW